MTIRDRLVSMCAAAAGYQGIRAYFHLPNDHPHDLMELASEHGPLIYGVAQLRSALQNFVDEHATDPNEETYSGRAKPHDCARCKQARSALERADVVLEGTQWQRPKPS